MRQSKILVLGGKTPGSMTSVDRALKLIARGKAEFVDDTTIRMMDQPKAAAIPFPAAERSRKPLAHGDYSLRVVPFKPEAFIGQTFLHYPQAA